MFIDELWAERTHLERVLKQIDKDIKSAPPGTLRIGGVKKKPVFYYRKNPSERLGTYIKTSNMDVAQKLAQKSYAQRCKLNIAPKLDLIDALIKDYDYNSLLSVQNSLPEIRQKLITPYRISDEEYVQNWLSTPYDQNTDYPENLIFKTANGELVRSKSEVIIANTLLRLGIPYKYEMPFYYTKTQSFRTDFTALNVKKRKQVYIEHCGRMHKENYRDSFFYKLKKYSNAGLVLGKDIIFTFEDEDHPFDVSVYEKTFQDLLLKD
ncbi:MAG: hypothetical protein E7304_11385 [Butyrivibrio sp.]|uniref:hypothetical protein n=1 Tax=Butyrivibrio sp. TaxID=28121 RepID=UPI001EC32431|nr:hypothetical protein [Butyrivibrio sp.]MBE5841992.1 hypothetical protein [Butyrivibrio sp.]